MAMLTRQTRLTRLIRTYLDLLITAGRGDVRALVERGAVLTARAHEIQPTAPAEVKGVSQHEDNFKPPACMQAVPTPFEMESWNRTGKESDIPLRLHTIGGGSGCHCLDLSRAARLCNANADRRRAAGRCGCNIASANVAELKGAGRAGHVAPCRRLLI